MRCRGRSHRAPGRQHRAGRRIHPRRQRHPGGAEPSAPECGARHRHGQSDSDRRSRLRTAEPAGGRGARRLPVSPEPGGRGQLHHRRQPGDQRGRHAGRALRQFARPVPRPGGGDGARRDLGRTLGPAQGQHRLRPARSVHRQRGHAGHHHCGDLEALSAAGSPAHGLGVGAQPRGRGAAAGAGACSPGSGPDRFRGDGAVRVEPGGPALQPDAGSALPAGSLLRAAGELGPRVRSARTRPVRAPAGNRAGTRLRHRRGGGRKPDPGAPALAHPRSHSAGPGRRGPQHQARHLGSGVAHSRVLPRDRCAAAAADPRRPAGELRPSWRRQPALQRAGAGGRQPGRASLAAVGRASQFPGVRLGAALRRLHLRRARRGKPEGSPSWSGTSRRSRWR